MIKIGNRWIVGFDKERIVKELGLGGFSPHIVKNKGE